MTFDYARPKATADRLLTRYGQAGKLLKYTKSGPAYDPVITWPEHDCTFAVMEYANREVDGTRVLATDKKVILAKGSLSVDPTTADKLKIGTVEHSIIRVEPLAPGGVTVMFTLQCRR